MGVGVGGPGSGPLALGPLGFGSNAKLPEGKSPTECPGPAQLLSRGQCSVPSLEGNCLGSAAPGIKFPLSPGGKHVMVNGSFLCENE